MTGTRPEVSVLGDELFLLSHFFHGLALSTPSRDCTSHRPADLLMRAEYGFHGWPSEMRLTEVSIRKIFLEASARNIQKRKSTTQDAVTRRGGLLPVRSGCLLKIVADTDPRTSSSTRRTPNRFPKQTKLAEHMPRRHIKLKMQITCAIPHPATNAWPSMLNSTDTIKYTRSVKWPHRIWQ